MRIPNILSIAGSDPSGGAGIQADLKTFGALGAYGMTVITALTAQNTRGVMGVRNVPAEFVVAQIDAVLADVRVDAVKIGMVASAENAVAIADALMRHSLRDVVLDPVLVATSGQELLASDALSALRDHLVQRATVLTPNLPEAGALLKTSAPTTLDQMLDAARDLHALGPRIVYLKGGHLEGDDTSPDVVFDSERVVVLRERRIETANTHGTGCTLSAAIAALLPQTSSPLEAFRRAKSYVTEAIAASEELDVGSGHGPVHHFHAFARAAIETTGSL